MRSTSMAFWVLGAIACSSGGSASSDGADAGVDASGGTGAVGFGGRDGGFGGGGTGGGGGTAGMVDDRVPYADCSACPDMACFALSSEGVICPTSCPSSGECPPPGSGTAEPFCDPDNAPGHPNGFCMLRCSTPGDQAECPDGMECQLSDGPGLGNVCVWPEPCLPIAPGPCRLHPPSCGGCGADETCDLRQGLVVDGVTTCRPVGSVPNLGECDPSSSECGAAETCVGQPTGLCRALCSEDADCEGSGVCRPLLADAPPAPSLPGAAVCSTPCNPFDPSDTTDPFVGCPTGVGCRLRSVEGGGSITDCILADATLTEGDACTVFCAPGLLCLEDAAGETRCQVPCVVDASPTDCTAGTCTSLGLDLTGIGEVGYCQLPAP